jgi:hypothetical protein
MLEGPNREKIAASYGKKLSRGLTCERKEACLSHDSPFVGSPISFSLQKALHPNKNSENSWRSENVSHLRFPDHCPLFNPNLYGG